jgi:YfiH family protein
MIVEPLDDVALLRFSALARQPELAHAITTKPWNMACHCGPDADLAIGRRLRLCQIVNLPFDRLTCAEQVHGTGLALVNGTLVGAGRSDRSSAVPGVDGLLTDSPGVGLMVLSADCPLILVFDPRRPAVGVAHASWRGTVGRITYHLVDRMRMEFGSRPEKLWAGIGPSAGPDRYVVGEEVQRSAEASLGNRNRYLRATPGGVTFDLWSANRDLLIAAGVRPDHIEVAGVCTIQDERFFSFRREGAAAGRFALVAGLRSP